MWRRSTCRSAHLGSRQHQHWRRVGCRNNTPYSATRRRSFPHMSTLHKEGTLKEHCLIHRQGSHNKAPYHFDGWERYPSPKVSEHSGGYGNIMMGWQGSVNVSPRVSTDIYIYITPVTPKSISGKVKNLVPQDSSTKYRWTASHGDSYRDAITSYDFMILLNFS